MKRGHVPIRQCRGCGTRRPQQELRRWIFRDGRLVESREKSGGRAVYCCPDQHCRERMLRNRKMLKQALRLQD